MGFFSWKTADTDESIGNNASGFGHDDLHGPVYMLSPDGEHIKESSYDGYGVFGGVDAYVWLSLKNLPEQSLTIINYLTPLSGDDLIGLSNRMLGLDSYSSAVAKLSFDNISEVSDKLRDLAIYHFSDSAMFDPVTDERVINGRGGIPFRYDEPIERYDGKTLNELTNENFFVIKAVEPEFPLKFSFDENAKYDALPASGDCPDQGFFFSESPSPR